MLRRTFRALLFNVSNESPDYRAKPGTRHLLLDVADSPYKEQFKEYWATPVPFADREYGVKPKIGEPIPTRRAATAIVVAKNNHINPQRIARGEDNDYKVLMLYRQGKRHYVKDQFIFAGEPITLDDTCEDWTKVLRRRGVITQWPDIHSRITAMRALFVAMNMLLIPPEGGAVAEVEGPPGPRKWHLMCSKFPKAMRHLLDVLELPMENVLKHMKPFRRIITPTTEKFRFDNTVYLVTSEKMGEVEYTLSVKGEKLVWVSPMEAMARFNAEIMNMPTPNLITLSELHNECPLFDDVTQLSNTNVPRVVEPELYRHGQSKVATVVLPGDISHSQTTEEDKAQHYVRRMVYEKDVPFGVRAIFDERPATIDELHEHLEQEKPLLLEEASELDEIYAHVPYRKREPEEQFFKKYYEEEKIMQANYNELARESPYTINSSANNLNSIQSEEVDDIEYDMHTTSIGKTLYPIPSFQLQDGKENADGIISPRLNYMDMKEKDNTETKTQKRDDENSGSDKNVNNDSKSEETQEEQKERKEEEEESVIT